MKLFVDKKEIKLEFANTFLKRLKGFMGKKNIKTALRFKTKSIHTFFMREPIDLLLTTKDNKILYIYKSFSPNKILIKKDTYYIYELPNNFLKNTSLNSKIKIIKK